MKVTPAIGPSSRSSPRFRNVCRSHLHSHFNRAHWLRPTARTCFEGPFGEVVRKTGDLANANPFRFSTKYQDDETDIIVYPARPYSPSTGRFLCKDPIAEEGGPNLHGFAVNDGVNAVDPVGWNTFRIGFRGLGSKSVYGNQVMDTIGAEIGAQMYSQNESDNAVTTLLKEMDGNGDRTISCAESQQHTIKVFGYSYGGIAAIGFAQKLDQLLIKTGGSPKDPQGYKLCCPIQVQVLLTIDPVQLMNPAGGVSDNVDQFYNYYQQRGGYAVFKDSNGSADAKYGHFGSWFSSMLKGSEISPVNAKSSSQTRVDTDMAAVSISGKFFQDAGQLTLYGSDVNHDVMPLFLAEKAINLMR